MNKKSLVIIILITTIIILGAIVLLQNNPSLTITTTPYEAQVFINDNYTALTPYSTTLAKGSYTVRVTKPGFHSYQEQITLNSDKKVNINLTAINQNIPPLVAQKNRLLTIDPETSKLIEISPSKNIIIYDQPISFFSYSSPLVAVIKKNITDSFTYINLDDGTIKDISIAEIKPIIGLSLSPDIQKIYFLGNFSAQKLSSTLYSSPLLQKKINSLTTSSYTKIYPLTSPYILALMEADGPDATKFIIINETNSEGSPINTSQIDYNAQYLQFISQTSSESALFKHPYTSKIILPTKPGFIPVWLSENNILLVKPFKYGANYQYFNTIESSLNSEKNWSEIEAISIHKIPGISEGKIAIIDKQNNIIFFNPPTQ